MPLVRTLSVGWLELQAGCGVKRGRTGGEHMGPASGDTGALRQAGSPEDSLVKEWFLFFFFSQREKT